MILPKIPRGNKNDQLFRFFDRLFHQKISCFSEQPVGTTGWNNQSGQNDRLFRLVVPKIRPVVPLKKSNFFWNNMSFLWNKRLEQQAVLFRLIVSKKNDMLFQKSRYNVLEQPVAFGKTG